VRLQELRQLVAPLLLPLAASGCCSSKLLCTYTFYSYFFYILLFTYLPRARAERYPPFSALMSFFHTLSAAALLAAALASPTWARAQTAPAPTDSARSYKHQLGLTLSPQFSNLFTPNRVLPLGLLYKRQLRPGRALRLRLTAYYSRHDTASAGGAFYIQQLGPDARAWELNALAGYEWQHQLGRRWQLNYGLEAGIGFHSEHRDYTNHYSNPIGFDGAGPYTDTDVGFRDLSRWQGQGRGFAGLSYALSSRLRLFAETGVGVSYRHQNSWGSYTTTVDNPNYSVSPGGIYRDHIINTWRLNYFPVQVLGLASRF
jgi:hypothetical protein